MKEIIVTRAEGILSSDEVEPAILRIEGAPANIAIGKGWEERYRDFYDNEASLVVEALYALPGGTLDRVLIALLSRKASLWRVPWPKDRDND